MGDTGPDEAWVTMQRERARKMSRMELDRAARDTGEGMATFAQIAKDEQERRRQQDAQTMGLTASTSSPDVNSLPVSPVGSWEQVTTIGKFKLAKWTNIAGSKEGSPLMNRWVVLDTNTGDYATFLTERESRAAMINGTIRSMGNVKKPYKASTMPSSLDDLFANRAERAEAHTHLQMSGGTWDSHEKTKARIGTYRRMREAGWTHRETMEFILGKGYDRGAVSTSRRKAPDVKPGDVVVLPRPKGKTGRVMAVRGQNVEVIYRSTTGRSNMMWTGPASQVSKVTD